MTIPICIPTKVQALLDEASAPDGPYSARPTKMGMDLIETKSGRVVRQVKWKRAEEWAAGVLREAVEGGAAEKNL